MMTKLKKAQKMKEIITIVSGLPRSGTSMMMKMLQAGGLEIVTDDIRKADEDNPRGYFEFEKVKKIKQDSSWLDSTKGKAFKMVSQLLYDLPLDRNYKIIFLRRNMQEILASQRKMLQRQSSYNDSEDDVKMGKLFEKHLTEIEGWLKAQKNMSTIYINYNDVIEHPRRNAQRVNKFLDNKLNVKNMISAVDSLLYRNRAKNNTFQSPKRSLRFGFKTFWHRYKDVRKHSNKK
jgi:hypothetical protein